MSTEWKISKAVLEDEINASLIEALNCGVPFNVVFSALVQAEVDLMAARQFIEAKQAKQAREATESNVASTIGHNPCLTFTSTSGHHSPAAVNPAAGLGSSKVRGDKPRSNCNAAFLRLVFPYGWAGRESRKALPVRTRSANPFGSAHPLGRGRAVRQSNWSTHTMSKSISINRETAARINPLISELWTEDTLHNAACVVFELGYLISDTELATEHMFHVFGMVSAALNWERENIRSAAQARKDRGNE